MVQISPDSTIVNILIVKSSINISSDASNMMRQEKQLLRSSLVGKRYMKEELSFSSALKKRKRAIVNAEIIINKDSNSERKKSFFNAAKSIIDHRDKNFTNPD